MPKTASSIKSKVNKIVAEFTAEFTTTPKGDLYCRLCNCIVQHDKRFYIDRHRSAAKHQRLLHEPSSSSQTFIVQRPTDFTSQVVSAFLSADIPLHKVRNPQLKQLFVTMGYPLPSESSCRQKVNDLFDADISRTLEMVKDSQIFMVVDEADVCGIKYLHILIGSLDRPSKTYMLDCLPLSKSPDSQMVVQAIDDAAHKLGLQREKFSLMVSDAAPYMVRAAKTLQLLYPQLLHITCVAHLLHNCAMKVKVYYNKVDMLIAGVKAITVKNKSRQSLFDAIGQPPLPIVTRWASWLNAAMYYANHLPEVQSIVRGIEGGGVLVGRAKDVVEDNDLANQLVEISQCYQQLATLVQKMEHSSYTVSDAVADLASLYLGVDRCRIRQYIDKRLASNDIITISNCRREDISPTNYALLQNCNPTSASVERSFSMLNKILAKDRNFLPDNVKKYIVCHYNRVAE